MKRIVFFLILYSIPFGSVAQRVLKSANSEIYESIQKLNFFGSVLYLAAHPDDENTRLISYFSNQTKARTAYLSLTRGDGGQNLIGSELRELLGIIRTQELLAARSIDGGEQFFTRANDFGYSKHPNETLQIWNKEEVLKDIVAIIRKFKPDVIINRFDTASAGKTHGHHTSSALLSAEAFDLVNDASYKAHDLYEPWKVNRLFFNTTWWFYGSKENFAKADKSNLLTVDTGVFFPTSGMSNTEIAALSRSKHQSQGFGNTGTRGGQLEYLEFLKGDKVKNKTNIFEGIDTTWARVDGGVAIEKILSKVEKEYNFRKPSASVPDLLKAYQLILKLKDEHWKSIKLEQIKNIISACTGLYLEVVADASSSYPSDKVSFNIEAINRSTIPIKLKKITIKPMHGEDVSALTMKVFNDSVINLQDNKRYRHTLKGIVPNSVGYTNPYWLNQKGTLGMYSVSDKKLIGSPETPRNITATFDLDIDGYVVSFQKDIVYKYNDPVHGEVYQPYEIIPPVSIKTNQKIIISKPKEAIEVQVTVTSYMDNVNGNINFDLSDGWSARPQIQNIHLSKKGEEKTVTFLLNSTSNQTVSFIKPTFVITNETYNQEIVEVNYNHIPKQTILLPSEAKVVRLDIKRKGQHIGYIQGAGDQIPTSLREIGYTVVELKENEISAKKLQKFDAVILGIRAYNVNDRAKFYQKELHKYAENGGTLIVQYNTSRNVKVAQIAPYALELSRDRVTDENAKVTLINTTHELLNFPNKISEKDFENWVQERGLYFPNKWAKEFTPLLSMHDKGESPKEGSLLVAKYGKGYFIYTGLSFFRELPVGVPGAYKLFANMISIGKNEIEPLKD